MRFYLVCVLSFKYLMENARYSKFRYRGERLWLRITSVNDENVVGRVWNHPVNPGLRFGQMIQILFVIYWMFGTWFK